MDYRTQKELLGETRLSALFSPLLANRWLWLEAIIIPIIGIGLCWLRLAGGSRSSSTRASFRGRGSRRCWWRCATG